MVTTAPQYMTEWKFRLTNADSKLVKVQKSTYENMEVQRSLYESLEVN